MNNVFETMWKEITVVKFDVLSQHSLGGTQEKELNELKVTVPCVSTEIPDTTQTRWVPVSINLLPYSTLHSIVCVCVCVCMYESGARNGGGSAGRRCLLSSRALSFYDAIYGVLRRS
jgi:hypothetical protein